MAANHVHHFNHTIGGHIRRLSFTDVLTSAQRSCNISRIKAKNTKPEMLVRKYLHAQGFHYKLHNKTLPGKPDLVLSKYKTVIFMHGCFWHGHINCKYFTIPKTRTEWWTEKINKNILNDVKAVKLLRKDGWEIITVWEGKLKKNKMEKTTQKISEKLQKKKEVFYNIA